MFFSFAQGKRPPVRVFDVKLRAPISDAHYRRGESSQAADRSSNSGDQFIDPISLHWPQQRITRSLFTICFCRSNNNRSPVWVEFSTGVARRRWPSTTWLSRWRVRSIWAVITWNLTTPHLAEQRDRTTLSLTEVGLKTWASLAIQHSRKALYGHSKLSWRKTNFKIVFFQAFRFNSSNYRGPR